MSATTAEAAASALRTARDKRLPGTAFSATDPGLDEAWGYRVQERDLAHRLAAGEQRTGAKLGLTSAAKQQTMGVHQPVVGFLTDVMASVDGILGRTAQPRIEPEIAFRLSRSISAPLTLSSAAEVIDGVAAAFEIIDSRFAGFGFGLPDVVADNTSAAGYLLGCWTDPASLPDLATLTCVFTVEGEVLHTATGAAILGHPLRALVHLAEHLSRRGETLPAGAIVLAGALTDAVPLRPGVRYRAEIEPLGAVTLRV